MKSLSYSNLGIQLIGVDDVLIYDNWNISEKIAKTNINKAQTKNIQPLLSLSYYEYSQVFQESDIVQSIVFLEYSKQFSILSVQMINCMNLNIEEIIEENNNLMQYLGLILLFLVALILKIGRKKK